MVLAPRAPSSHAPMTNPQPRRLRAQARSNRSYVARRLGCPLRRPPPVVRRRDRSRCGQHADGVASTTHSSGGFARRAATVAFGVNPPEQRPSLSAATSDRRSARPSSTALWRWSADCPPFFEMRRDPGTLPRPPHRDFVYAAKWRLLPIFMERRFTRLIRITVRKGCHQPRLGRTGYSHDGVFHFAAA